MSKKTMGMAVVAATLIAAAILYGILQLRTYSAADIVAAYEEAARYNEVAVEYPLDETLFPPELVPPTLRWQDSTRGARIWLVRLAFADGRPALQFVLRRQQWTPPPAGLGGD